MFRIELEVPSNSDKINYSDHLFTIGSCFANAMGKALKDSKFQIEVNPFGTIFNPISIFKILTSAIKNDISYLGNAVENNNTWFHYDIHSEIYGFGQEELIDKIQERLSLSHQKLHKSDFIIITLGTAFVYRHIATNAIVANCHKVPASNFRKELLSAEEIVLAFDVFYKILQEVNPRAKIILTVSPVRHTKDTLVLNSVSKSLLRLACHELSLAYSSVSYFPSYEIMMDDLRDYRFYKPDMIHPTEQAEEYIFLKFVKAYLDDSSFVLMNEWNDLKKMLNHKPFRIDTEEYQIFLTTLLHKLQPLSAHLDLKEELEEINNKISRS